MRGERCAGAVRRWRVLELRSESELDSERMSRFAEPWKQWLSAAARDSASSQRLQIPRESSGRPAFGILTGQDLRALNTIAPLWEMLANADDASQRAVIKAARWIISTMQESARPFARELIARTLDWSDRDRIWALVTQPEQPPQLRPADAPPTGNRPR